MKWDGLEYLMKVDLSSQDNRVAFLATLARRSCVGASARTV